MAESVSLESVLTELVGRLKDDLDEVIALIQRPLALAAEAVESDESELAPDSGVAFA